MKIKSKKLVHLEEAIPVYDIEVPGNSNFALSAGVIVHNSKDSADGVCGALWGAQKYYSENRSTKVIQHNNVNQAVKYLTELNRKRWISDEPDDNHSWVTSDYKE